MYSGYAAARKALGYTFYVQFVPERGRAGRFLFLLSLFVCVVSLAAENENPTLS